MDNNDKQSAIKQAEANGHKMGVGELLGNVLPKCKLCGYMIFNRKKIGESVAEKQKCLKRPPNMKQLMAIWTESMRFDGKEFAI